MKSNNLKYYTSYRFRFNRNSWTFRNYSSCFSSLFYGINDNNNNGELRVFICTDDSLNKKNQNNICLLSKSSVKKYINWISEISGLKLKIYKPNKIDINNEMDTNGFYIGVKFKDNTKYEVKLIATLIRQLYEVPFNLQLKTAFLMNRLKEFKHLDFSERLCIAINSFISDDNRSVHSSYYGNHVILINNKDIKGRYNYAKKNLTNVETFYKTKDINTKTIQIYNENELCCNLEKGKINKKLRETLNYNYNLMK